MNPRPSDLCAALLVVLPLTLPCHHTIHAASTPVRKHAAVPAWLSEVAGTETSEIAPAANTLVLLDEADCQVSPNGKLRAVYRRAVRIEAFGRDAAVATFSYHADHQKIGTCEAWILGTDGQLIRAFTRRDAVDVALDRDRIHTDARSITIDASAHAGPGTVFGVVCEIVGKPLFPDMRWAFQSALPVALSRFSCELPAGWTAQAVTLVGDEFAPQMEGGNRWTWERRALPAVVDEPWAPPARDRIAAIAVTWRPPAARRDRAPGHHFANWRDVSQYIAQLHDPQAAPDPSITAKARELTANSATQEERIRALAAYVQGLNYASIQRGTGRGGGYTPNPAAQVFRRNYGDCKDKTILLRALLKAVGIESFSALALAQERRAIFDAWPSPQQFDHCVIAIAVDDAIQTPAVTTHPVHGGLLIFDPTSGVVPPGGLPAVQQGGRVLIAAGTPHDLVDLPWTKPEENQLVRRTEIRREAPGQLRVSVEDVSSGSIAARQQANFRAGDAAAYASTLGDWLTRSVRGARLMDVDVRDRAATPGGFERRMTFTAPYFTPRSIAVNPPLLPRALYHDFAAVERSAPIVIEPHAHEETIRIEIPSGFVLAEWPAPIAIERDFGTYRFAGELLRDGIEFRRTLHWRTPVLPAENYAEVRAFFDAVNRAEQALVVLQPREE